MDYNLDLISSRFLIRNKVEFFILSVDTFLLFLIILIKLEVYTHLFYIIDIVSDFNRSLFVSLVYFYNIS